MLPAIWLALFADQTPVISEGGIWGAGVIVVVTTIIARFESLYATISKISVDWLGARTTHDSVVIKQLNDHIERLDKALDQNRKEIIDLRSEMAFLIHEQGENMAEEERLWGHMTLLDNYALRVSKVLGEHGVAIDSPPTMPTRRKRTTNEEFRERTKATNERLAREVAAVLPTMIPPPDKGQKT